VARAASRKLEVRSEKVEVKGQKPDGRGQKAEIRGRKVDAKNRTALDLDRVIHERLRLGIVSALAATEWLTFNDLKRLLQTTDGNLSVHARKLEEAQYIACEKSFDGRVPRTEYRLTAAGRRALEKYVAHMESIIKAVRE
jgi:DNA-binding HxlR family transcriptional regulator